MAGVLGALNEVLHRFVERIFPFSRVGTYRRVRVSVVEASAKQCTEICGQRLPRKGGPGRRQRNTPSDSCAVKEIPLRYAGFHLRLFTWVGVYSPERVRPLHQKLVYDYCEREVVVVYVSVYMREASAL